MCLKNIGIEIIFLLLTQRTWSSLCVWGRIAKLLWVADVKHLWRTLSMYDTLFCVLNFSDWVKKRMERSKKSLMHDKRCFYVAVTHLLTKLSMHHFKIIEKMFITNCGSYNSICYYYKYLQHWGCSVLLTILFHLWSIIGWWELLFVLFWRY